MEAATMGYRAYDYLGKNSPLGFRLVDDAIPASQEVLQLEGDGEERARLLLRESITIDLHLHPARYPADIKKDFVGYTRAGRIANAYAGMKRSGLTACLGDFGESRVSSFQPFQFDDVVWDLGMRLCDISHQDYMFVASRASDVLEAKAQDRIALFPSLETASCIANDLDKVDVLYGLGIRCMGLTFNSKNTIGDGSNERNPGGLSKFGLRVIERMNQVGMLIDIAHASAETAAEAIDASEHPIICSHGLADLPGSNSLKKKTDAIAHRLAKKGGLVAIQAVPNITTSGPRQTLDDVVDHIEHFCGAIGADFVGVGMDRFFGDHVAFDMVMEEYGEPTVTKYEASSIEGLEDPGQWSNIVRGMISRGFSDEDIRKVVGQNAMRVLKVVIG